MADLVVVPNKRRMMQIFKWFIPEGLWNLLRELRARRHFLRCSSWDHAASASVGYADERVFEAVRSSARLVSEGRAVYERDSHIFEEIQYSFPLLASLLLVAENCRSLRVVDFGGGLGTTLQQNRRFIRHLNCVCQWRIVEQPKIVEVGKAEFTTGTLSFHGDLHSASAGGVDVVLFGSSICYIENPSSVIKDILERKVRFIIIDRTPFIMEDRDAFFVQRVPRSICESSYPVRFFSKNKFLAQFSEQYELVESWLCELQEYPKATTMGFVFKLR